MNNKIKESFQTRKFKSGTYSVGIVSIAVVIVVVINLLVNALPANITKHDLSYNQLYSLSSVTEEFVKWCRPLIGPKLPEFVDFK